MFEFPVLPPLALYVHLPWCVRKCPYCDFNSHALAGELPEGRYVDALLADLAQDLPRVWGRSAGSVYLGGGTPSLFSAEAIDRLLAGIRARLPLSPQAEITLEANPGAADAGRFAGYRQAGVNRLSIGVQSFSDTGLSALGRIHDAQEARAAVAAAGAAGFENVNVDLMFGLPGGGPEEALADLDAAIELHPAHLSVYQLTVEPHTRFHAHPPPVPGDELLWTMQSALQARLREADYRQYEVSAYARPGRRARHNLNYWRFGDYLGIGAGAHGKISTPGGIVRLAKTRHPRAYMEGATGGGRTLAGERRLAPADAVFEFLLNALRLPEGFPATLFRERTGLSPAHLDGPLGVAVDRGLLRHDKGWIRTTARGWRYLNDVLLLFLPPGRG